MSTATKLGLACATLAVVCVCLFIAIAKPFSGPAAGPAAAPDPTAQQYVIAQYHMLETGMSQAKVDRLMGGGGTVQEAVTGGQTWTNVYYTNADGSMVGVTFVGGKLYQKTEAGL